MEVEEKEMVVVHFGEYLPVKWNPETHESVETRVPDGTVITHYRPKADAHDLERLGDQ